MHEIWRLIPLWFIFWNYHRQEKTEEVSGCLRRLWRSMEGWRLVCDCVLWHVPSKNNIGSEFRVSVRIHSVIGCMGSCGNHSQKKLKNNEIGVQWRCNYELIMALTSATQFSSMRTMPILDDYVVIMFPSDLLEWDNRGKKGVRVGQKFLREPVSN